MIEVFDLSRATDLDKQKLPIKTVNGVEPDAEGAVKIDVGVKTVNGAAPDEAGAVNIEIGATEADIIAAADKALAGHTAGTGQVDLTAALSAITALEAKVARYEAELESRVHLIESGTSEDGSSWYRKYSDGWIEQGGREYCTTKNKKAITFPHAFTGTKYGIFFTVEKDTSTSPEHCDDATVTTLSITNTSVNAYMFDAGGNSYSAFVRWYACGY